MNLDEKYWNSRYSNNETGWDIGYPSTPIVQYLNIIRDKEIKILIPGCGNAYEGKFCFENNFTNVYLLDISKSAVENVRRNFPVIPASNIIHQDFFEHEEEYDLVIEQTFFCALDPELRGKYVEHMARIIKPNGKLIGLLFNKHFEHQGPPFGGTKAEYQDLFSRYFKIGAMDLATNSIPQRQGSELFIKLTRKRNF